jgi:hypothetical protein
VVVKKAKIKFENFPGKYRQFVILDLESKKKTISCRGRAQKARLLFLGTKSYGAKSLISGCWGYEEKKGEEQDGG